MVARILTLCGLLLLSMACNAADYIRDPFIKLSEAPNQPATQPLTVKPLSQQKLVLKAILWGKKPLANISGMIVAPGDRVLDFTVQQISRKTALLRKANDSITLVLEEDS